LQIALQTILVGLLQFALFAISKLYTTKMQKILQILQQNLQICKQVCKIGRIGLRPILRGLQKFVDDRRILCLKE
jgi:hypothetical protein